MKISTPDQLSDRDHHLISRALHVASLALRNQEHPPLSDIDGMNELLDKYYPRDKEVYDWQTNLQLAMRLGFKYQPGETQKEDVERWIADHLPDDNVSDELHERRSGHKPRNWQ